MPKRRTNALDAWTAEVAAERRAIEVARRTKVTVYVHPKIAKAVRRIALDADVSANSVWVDALRRHLAELGCASFEEIIHGGEE